MPKHRYMTLKDQPDSRYMRMMPRGALMTPPALYDLSHYLGPVKDQGQLGDCTGFSWTSLREFLYRRYFIFEKDQTVAKSNMILSPLFLYYMERKLEGDIGQDNGAQSRTGGKVLQKYGCCLETLDPYQPANFTDPPTDAQVAAALKYIAGTYLRVPDVLSLKTLIASGYVASIGLEVYESFESDQAAISGNIPIPQADEQLLGGHELTPYGYDDTHVNADLSKGAFHFLNSWGDTWGVKVGPTRKEPGGSGWLPYGYWAVNLVSDMWTARLGV